MSFLIDFFISIQKYFVICLFIKIYSYFLKISMTNYMLNGFKYPTLSQTCGNELQYFFHFIVELFWIKKAICTILKINEKYMVFLLLLKIITCMCGFKNFFLVGQEVKLNKSLIVRGTIKMLFKMIHTWNIVSCFLVATTTTIYQLFSATVFESVALSNEHDDVMFKLSTWKNAAMNFSDIMNTW